MSLFDVIKYPVSIDFEQEDLERLPEDIYSEWHKCSCEAVRIKYFIHSPVTPRRDTVAFILAYADIKQNMPIEALRQYLFHSLKQIIAEYESV